MLLVGDFSPWPHKLKHYYVFDGPRPWPRQWQTVDCPLPAVKVLAIW